MYLDDIDADRAHVDDVSGRSARHDARVRQLDNVRKAAHDAGLSECGGAKFTLTGNPTSDPNNFYGPYFDDEVKKLYEGPVTA